MSKAACNPGKAALEGFERSAELLRPAPSQIAGLRCTVGSGRRLAKCAMLSPWWPKEVQKGAMQDARASAKGVGYSAVRALRNTPFFLTPAMSLWEPGGCLQIPLSCAMLAKLAKLAQDFCKNLGRTCMRERMRSALRFHARG